MVRGGFLVSWVFLVPLAVLIVNDHYVKARHPGAVSGILSDIAGLCYFPILLVAIAEIIGRLLPGRPYATSRWFAVSSAVTGVAFIVMKFTPAGQKVYVAGTTWAGTWLPLPSSTGSSGIVADPWDLLALAVLVIPVVAGRRWRPVRPPE